MSQRGSGHPGAWRAIHHYVPGEVVIAVVRNPHQCAKPTDKARPVVLVASTEPAASGWLVAGLTTKARYKTSGAARPRVFATPVNGLNGISFLWGESLTWIPAEDLRRPIGMVDVAMAETIIANCKLTVPQIDGLRRAAVPFNWGEAA